MIYNTKIIEYDDYLHIEWFERPIIRKEEINEKEERKEIIEDIETIINNPKRSEKQEVHNLTVSLNRSKNNLFRIARSNEWDLFITITFDRKITDASDYNVVSKKITTFLNNLRKRGSPELKYLIVPELHKDGKNYHFHGLLYRADSLILEDSGHIDKFGEKIYNISNWKIGFTTAQRIKDQNAVRNYIGKYITKDLMNRLKYKKRYFASKNCNVNEEMFSQNSIQDIYDLYGDRISYIKTINVNGVNRIKYMEILKD